VNAAEEQDAEECGEGLLLRTAEQRLRPSLKDPNYLVLRARRLIFSEWAEQLGKNLTVMDVGGRYQPYRPLFEGHAGRYIAVDVVKTNLVSVVADGQWLPFATGSLDLVILTQVIDYFPDPSRAVREIYAALKPGGILIASAPACAPRFAEGEYWRFTGPGLRTLLSDFANVEIVPELHSLASVIRTINLAVDSFVHFNAARWIYRRTVCPLLNILGRTVEKLGLTSNDQFTANYSVRAIKK